jgi:hypothetical protein
MSHCGQKEVFIDNKGASGWQEELMVLGVGRKAEFGT